MPSLNRKSENLGRADVAPSAMPGLQKALDVWGIFRSHHFVWIVIAISTLLVLLEAKYNIDLLHALSDPSADGSIASELSKRGKLLAAFGISWAVGRGLLSKIRPAIAGAVLFLALVAATYHGLDYTYTKVIADLKPEIKVKGYNLYSYRRDLLTGVLMDPDIPLPKNEPVLGRIFMGAFPMVILDDRFMLPAQDIVERKAAYKGETVLASAADAWPEYERKMQELSNAYTQYIDASKKALGMITPDRDWAAYNGRMQELSNAHAEFVKTSRMASGQAKPDREWAQYDGRMRELLRGYDRYIDGSRQAARYGSMGTQRFRERSGGLDPNPSLSRMGFVSMLRASHHPEGEKLRQAEQRVLVRRPDGKPIYGSDLPYFMDYRQFCDWFASQAKEAIRSGGFQANPSLTRVQFVEMLRQSKHPKGEELRKAEGREVGRRADGEPLYARDVPYFMSKEEFNRWFAEQAKATLAANGFEPKPDLTREQFVAMLRTSKHPKGEELRKAEGRELGKRPDGTTVYARDIPYFMAHDEYSRWFSEKVKDAIAMAVPTAQNVEKFDRIKDVNAAIFLPPMAIISSLTSALTNGISLALIALALALTAFGPTKAAGEAIRRFTVPLMLVVFASLLYLMPSHVFTPGTPIHDLETQLHNEVGFAAKIWSRLSNLEKFIL